MPKICTDPKCPLNKYANNQKSPKDSCKIHGKACIKYSSDHARENRNGEHERTKYCKKLCRKKDQKLQETTTKAARCGICCKNERCQIIESTSIEPGTSSTDSLPIKRSKKHGMKKQIHEEKEEKSFCECSRRKRCCDRREQNQKMRKRVKYRSRRKRKRKDNWLTNCLRKLCFCVKTPVSYEQPNTYERSRETLLQSCKCYNTYRDKHKGTSKKSHHSKNTIFLADDKKTLREDTARYHRANGLEQKCQCINTIAKNRETSQHQSYLQGVLSKGFNIMCRGINFCI